MATTTIDPRVWVGCLACYNAGRLVGAWMPANEGPEYVPEGHGIACGRCWTPAAHWPASSCERGDGVHVPAIAGPDGSPHEEQWVMDHEGFGGLLSGECSPDEAARVAELLEAIEFDVGDDIGAVLAWASWNGETVTEWDGPTAERFRDEYAGQWPSGSDYAAELADELDVFTVEGGYGSERVDVSGRWPMTCIDWDRAWRDLELGDGYAAIDDGEGGVYVFRPS